MVRVIGW